MSEEASVRFPGERLTVDGDYATWRFVAEAYFLAQGVYDLILGVDAAPDVPETGTTQEQRIARDSWRKRDQRAMVLLLSGLHRSIVSAILSTTAEDASARTSAKVYQAVQDYFRPNVISRTIQIHTDLVNRKLQSKERILDYFSHVDGLVRQLCAAESRTYCIDEVYKYIVPGLPASYNSKLDVISETYRRKELTVEGLRASLLEKERQLETSDANDEIAARAFAMKSKNVNRPKPNEKGKNGKKNSRSGPICYRCGGVGHFARVCPTKEKSDGQDGKNANSSIGPKATLFNAQISNHYLEVSARVAQIALRDKSQRDNETILFDNGSTHTMTWNVEDLENTEDVDAKVVLPGGSTLEVTKVGDLRVTTLNGDGEPEHEFIVPDALLVPKLQVKVFAQKPYSRLGYGIHGFGNTFDFLDPDGETLFTVVDDEKSGLFKLRAKPTGKIKENSKLYLSVTDTSQTTQSSLGHSHPVCT